MLMTSVKDYFSQKEYEIFKLMLQPERKSRPDCCELKDLLK